MRRIPRECDTPVVDALGRLGSIRAIDHQRVDTIRKARQANDVPMSAQRVAIRVAAKAPYAQQAEFDRTDGFRRSPLARVITVPKKAEDRQCERSN